jgi:MFS family permease
MRTELLDMLQTLARWGQRAGIVLSVVFGGLVGLAFAEGVSGAWGWAFCSFLLLLSVGMASMILAVLGERVPPGDWREGFNLSAQIFLSQTTLFGGLAVATVMVMAVLRVSAGIPAEVLALRMLPGLYISTVVMIILTGPLFIPWKPAPLRRDRRR